MVPEMVIFPTKMRSGDAFPMRDECEGVHLVRPGTMNGSEREGDIAASKPTMGPPGEDLSPRASRGKGSSRAQTNARRGSHSNMYLMTSPPLTPRRRRISSSSGTSQPRPLSPSYDKAIDKPLLAPIVADSMSTLMMEDSNASLLSTERDTQRLGAFLQRSSHGFVGSEEDDAGSFAPSVPGVPTGACSVAPTVVSMDCSRTESMSTASTNPSAQQQEEEQAKMPPPPPLLEDDDIDEDDDVIDDDSVVAANTATPKMASKSLASKAPRKVFCRRGDKIGTYYKGSE